MTENKRIDEPTGTQTVGHEWDGIEELNTPLPRWWLWTLYLTIIWALIYTVFYPAWPLLNRATAGTLGWSSRGQLEQSLKSEQTARAPMLAKLAATDITKLPADKQLFNAAVAGGNALFKANCVQCHGSGAAGSPGYPNLNDNDWLWGGDIASIERTITYGVRSPGSAEAHMSAMPAFGRDGILKPEEIQQLVSYVRTLSGQDKASAASNAGAALFATNCVSCHGADGKGMREFGSPNLTDRIWLYGGSREALTTTITNARAGVMPHWNQKFDAASIKMLAAYVYSLGGGEATAPSAAVAEAQKAAAPAPAPTPVPIAAVPAK